MTRRCQVANCERVVRDGFARCDEHTEALFVWRRRTGA